MMSLKDPYFYIKGILLNLPLEIFFIHSTSKRTSLHLDLAEIIRFIDVKPVGIRLFRL